MDTKFNIHKAKLKAPFHQQNNLNQSSTVCAAESQIFITTTKKQKARVYTAPCITFNSQDRGGFEDITAYF